jgi:hypothetical protein
MRDGEPAPPALKRASLSTWRRIVVETLGVTRFARSPREWDLLKARDPIGIAYIGNNVVVIFPVVRYIFIVLGHWLFSCLQCLAVHRLGES